jgi:cell fate (sporulation/competence/biofilm development) regulator YlbF (YheA/YmcA/DUF963 family)
MEELMARLPEELQAAAEALCENLLASEPFVLYNRAETRLIEDSQAKNLLERLSTMQAELRSKQGSGSITQEEIDELRALQREVQQNGTIMAYANAQQGAVNYLREINQEISQLIGVDFASMARQSCC